MHRPYAGLLAERKPRYTGAVSGHVQDQPAQVGVVFYDERWHVGITDGTQIVDSRFWHGVKLRPLPPGWRRIEWLPDADVAEVWDRALSLVGGPYRLCTRLVCQSLGTQCVLLGTLRRELATYQQRGRVCCPP